jgi:hypothetical protein
MRPIVSALVLALATFACQPEKRITPATPSSDAIVPGVTNDSSNTLFASRPIRHCVTPSAQRAGSVEVLVDASGSMSSMRAPLPRVVNWLDLAVSRVRAHALTVNGTKLCEFNSKDGFAQCGPSIALRPGFRGAGDTNLHDAIRRSVQNALTFIVTDGVAAAGNSKNGDCAAAVDAACIARAFRDAIHPDGDARGENRGIWIIPLVVPHDGVFYTEKRVPVASFDHEATHEQIRTDMNVDVAVQDPQVDAGERLNFVYRGPRVLLLIVIANATDIGRAAVAALVEAMEQADVSRLPALKAYLSGIAAFDPLEVYPGIATSIEWGQSKDADETPVGTIDARLDAGTLYIDCPRKQENELTHIVPVMTRPASQQSRCVDMWSFPGFNYRLHASKPDTDAVLASFVKNYTTRDPLAGTSELALRIRCGGDQVSRRCGQNPLRTQYTATANYAETSRSLAQPQPATAAGVVDTISTLQPQREPHRVYALSETLRIFYDVIATEQYRVSIGDLTICNEEGATR